jgi:hypothetical protein
MIMAVEAVVEVVIIIVVVVVAPQAIHLEIVEHQHILQLEKVVVIQDLVPVHNIEDNQMVKHATIHN